MITLSRSAKIASLPGVAWLAVAGIYGWYEAQQYGAHAGPPDWLLLVFRIAFLLGALLCVVALALAVRGFARREWDAALAIAALGSAAYLASPWPRYGMEGLLRGANLWSSGA
jgi:hypothetical protein